MWNQWHYKRRIDIFYFKVNQSRSLDREMVLRRLQFHLKWQLAHLKSKSIFPRASSLLSFCNWFLRPFPRIFGDKQKHNSFSIYNIKKLCIFYNCVFVKKIRTSVHNSDGFLLFLKISSAVLPSDLHSSGVDTGPYQAFN